MERVIDTRPLTPPTADRHEWDERELALVRAANREPLHTIGNEVNTAVAILHLLPKTADNAKYREYIAKLFNVLEYAANKAADLDRPRGD